jgi:hypothetical protein
MPHIALQVPQSAQRVTEQSCSSQWRELQPLVSIMSEGHSLPPLEEKTWIWRCLCCWPPPQVLSHESQYVHDDIKQLMTSSPQVSVIRKSPWQEKPSPSAFEAISRMRYFWPSMPHPDQPLQSLKTQFVSSDGHAFSAQLLSSLSEPVHALPPELASSATSRLRW